MAQGRATNCTIFKFHHQKALQSLDNHACASALVGYCCTAMQGAEGCAFVRIRVCKSRAGRRGAVNRNFTEIALRAGTDKVTTHQYGEMYNRFLGPLQDQPLNFIEIGFAFGHSAEAWAEFLPNAKILEIEVACNEGSVKHSPLFKSWVESGKLKCGSITDWNFTGPVVAEHGTPHVVVDDGGHSPDEMKASFLSLFPRLERGGLFFMEDLKESYVVHNGFMQEVVHSLLDDLHRKDQRFLAMVHPPKYPAILSRLRSVTCQTELCIFERNDEAPFKGAMQFPSE
eukprot:gnl/TRDRNA2_/TRDRNA2_197312_c0_seq1.p1 gnl/TRDRNA2_/TRDRNA2_197312_c0~~gnl/TRDRNA2_/TRDRNA2_197312_c0_seq1.p1  ORF type:complete len:285 (+),score=23.93 gnl/TRDRNA2_/TRDRNA2_197312_c0_seq1:24-878(+)